MRFIILGGIAFSAISMIFLGFSSPNEADSYMETASFGMRDSAYIPKSLIDSNSVQPRVEEKKAISGEGPALAISDPVRLKIPKINVNSSLEYLGLTEDGAVDAPKGPSNAAWFNLGVRPGEIGSAVIVGHFGWKNGIPAVFDNLHKLKKGDKLHIEDDKGKIITFIVRELRTYTDNQIAPEVFGSTDDKAHLNLITCQGVWNKTKKSYSNRLVVFTDKEI